MGETSNAGPWFANAVIYDIMIGLGSFTRTRPSPHQQQERETAVTDIIVLYDGPIVKRRDAKANGLTKYFTGNECKHGHVDQRWTCSARCLRCQSISSKDHFDKNADKYNKLAAIRSKNNWAENKEKMSAAHRDWRLKNLDKRSEYTRNWWAGREDERNAARRDWAAKNPERASYHNKKNLENNRDTHRALNRKYRSRAAGADGSHTKEDIKSMILQQNNRCAEPTCKADFSETGYHVDHIMPLSLGGTNWPENLQCLCPSCNMSKGAKHPDEWAKYRGRNP